MASRFQTLSEFLENPFHKGSHRIDTDYESKYITFRNSNKITLKSVLESEGNFLLHLTVPSESQEGVLYDVVLQFFADSETVRNELTIKNYYLKFFSNSPSFVYRFAALYKEAGFLIDALQDKFEEINLATLPTQTNSEMKMEYDKSIYFACRFLTENKFATLTKVGILFRKTKNAAAFFSGISTFDDIKTSTDISKLEKSIKKEVQKQSGRKPEETTKKVPQGNKTVNTVNRITPTQKKAPIQKKQPQQIKPKITGTKNTVKKK